MFASRWRAAVGDEAEVHVIRPVEGQEGLFGRGTPTGAVRGRLVGVEQAIPALHQLVEAVELEFDGQYAGYLLNTQDNGGTGRFGGFEFSATQDFRPYLKFMPELLRGWDVFVNYTKFYKGEAPNRNGVITIPTAPNFYKWTANYGVSYLSPRRKIYVQVRTVINPSAITTYANGTTDRRDTYEARHQRWDFTLRYRFSANIAAELTGANIFKDPSRKFIQAGRVTQQRDFGSQYVLSFTANLDRLNLPFLGR